MVNKSHILYLLNLMKDEEAVFQKFEKKGNTEMMRSFLRELKAERKKIGKLGRELSHVTQKYDLLNQDFLIDDFVEFYKKILVKYADAEMSITNKIKFEINKLLTLAPLEMRRIEQCNYKEVNFKVKFEDPSKIDLKSSEIREFPATVEKLIFQWKTLYDINVKLNTPTEVHPGSYDKFLDSTLFWIEEYYKNELNLQQFVRCGKDSITASTKTKKELALDLDSDDPLKDVDEGPEGTVAPKGLRVTFAENVVCSLDIDKEGDVSSDLEVSPGDSKESLDSKQESDSPESPDGTQGSDDEDWDKENEALYKKIELAGKTGSVLLRDIARADASVAKQMDVDFGHVDFSDLKESFDSPKGVGNAANLEAAKPKSSLTFLFDFETTRSRGNSVESNASSAPSSPQNDDRRSSLEGVSIPKFKQTVSDSTRYNG